ncbi:AAA family ATPase [uncultured Pseudomonas sp.]|uniref:AAA family ATPase n=1 Tax=uncultured Pseudomonas sp. TaxID=114707 RepID=UPI00258F0001|nr:AAA family ATPase [uncultured Pseudomonas sp.]
MKLIKFAAHEVHEYLNFNINFNSDVNFIAGVNGSGKTSALNIIAAMLTPSLENLAKTKFSHAELHIVTTGGMPFSIVAKQADENLTLRIRAPESLGIIEPIRASIPELVHSPEHAVSRYRANSTFRFISNLPSPMYLSLDRRFIKETTPYDSSPFSFTKHWVDKSTGDSSADMGMKEALELISKKSAEIKDRQTLEDRNLRNKIILDSFFIGKDDHSSMVLPDKKKLQQLKTKQKTIKNTLINLDFKNEELSVMYDKFFDNLTSILNNTLEVISGHTPKTHASSRSATAKRKDSDIIPTNQKSNSKDINISLETSRVLADWFANSHQMARIDRLIKLIGEYESIKETLYEPLDKFTILVNSFLSKTDKRISVTNRGEVRIFIFEAEKPLTVLSSGERQIIIMLAHLTLNPDLPKSGIFIVDEPELSLHIAWQDMFLEAVQAASPDLQIILATHSPAIIGGRRKFYIPLNGGI